MVKKTKVKARKVSSKGPAKRRAASPKRKVAKSARSSAGKRLNVLGRIKDIEAKLLKEKAELSALRKKTPLEEISDYTFKAHDGAEVKLSDLFGRHKDLILIHNMGRGCPYCTMWADGFAGITKHLENRAAFVVVSKDRVDMQREFYISRGWNFRMFSSHDSTFNRDVGFETEKGGQLPGVSAFRKDESGKIFRTGYTSFGPGDEFCAVWPLLDLLKEGSAGWEPKFQY